MIYGVLGTVARETPDWQRKLPKIVIYHALRTRKIFAKPRFQVAK